MACYAGCEGGQGRLTRYTYAEITIAGQRHCFLVLDRRPMGADLELVIRGMTDSIAGSTDRRRNLRTLVSRLCSLFQRKAAVT